MLRFVFVGGGVANFVAATVLKSQYPEAIIDIYEAALRLGGRVFTHSIFGDLGGTYIGTKDFHVDLHNAIRVWAGIAQGKETLHKHAIEGYNNVGVMPARGGNPSLSDAQVIATVDWMVGNLK